MESLLTQPALSFSGERHDVADLVLTALMTGKWQGLIARTARGVGLAADHSAHVSGEEVETALAAFRYERRLIAAADLRGWLSERALEVADLRGVLRRRLVRERFPKVPSSPATVHEIATVVRAEAICTGALAQYAEELRAWHAAEDGLAEMEVPPTSTEFWPADRAVVEDLVAAALADAPSCLRTLESELSSRATRLCTLRSAYERFCAIALSHGAIEARLAQRRLDWTIVTGSELSFELEGAARETRLHVVHDGATLAQVAGELGLEPAQRELELGAAPAELSSELLAAGKGDLIGPWSERERWRVLEIDGRFEPESSAAGRVRAREELLSELLERMAAGKAGVLAAL